MAEDKPQRKPQPTTLHVVLHKRYHATVEGLSMFWHDFVDFHTKWEAAISDPKAPGVVRVPYHSVGGATSRSINLRDIEGISPHPDDFEK